MKIVNPCSMGCCPRAEISGEQVSEEGNFCVLEKEEEAELREKTLNGEL